MNLELKRRIQPGLFGIGLGAAGNNNVTISCDGYYKASGGGIATWAWVAVDANGDTIESNRGCAGRGEGMSHFVAGYVAVIDALSWIQANEPDTPINLHIDLELVVEQIAGTMNCAAANLRPLHEDAVGIIGTTKAELSWIPGALNKRAKALSRLEYQEQLAKGRLQ